jgi:GTP-binding protein
VARAEPALSPPAVKAEFMLSAAQARQFPEPAGFEVAVLGRSNCGKSSLLNRWLGRKSMARVGGLPGRTRLANFFKVVFAPGDPPMLVVDLPGYGYAAAPKATVESWRRLVGDYLSADRGPRLALLLMDIRRGAQDEERGLASWLSSMGIDYRIVATKSDKLPSARRSKALAALAKDLGGDPLSFSSLTGQGRERLIELVSRLQAEAAARALELEAVDQPFGEGEPG